MLDWIGTGRLQCLNLSRQVIFRTRLPRTMTDEEKAEIHRELERLRQEHRDLDTAIDALVALATADRLQIQRLKKRKLQLRDRVIYLEDMLTPDIIA